MADVLEEHQVAVVAGIDRLLVEVGAELPGDGVVGHAVQQQVGHAQRQQAGRRRLRVEQRPVLWLAAREIHSGAVAQAFTGRPLEVADAAQGDDRRRPGRR